MQFRGDGSSLSENSIGALGADHLPSNDYVEQVLVPCVDAALERAAREAKGSDSVAVYAAWRRSDRNPLHDVAGDLFHPAVVESRSAGVGVT